MQGKQSWLILLVNLIINTRTAQPDGFPPQFDGVQKLQYRAVVGQVVRLRCIVKGVPPPTITWTKNEKPLQLSNRIKTSNNRTVRIKGAIPSDQGNYTCFVENHFGKINMTMQLTVRGLGAPRFAEPEKLKRTFIAWPASHTIRLKCKAKGAPPLKYTWLKDGKRVTSRRLDPYINTTIWFLRLKELVPTDSGKYTCNVSNPYGSISHTYTVEVVGKPRSKPILNSSLPKNTSVQLGGNATMKCIVLLSGTLPDFRWLKWDKVTTANPKIEKDGTDNDGTSYHLIDPIHYTTIKVGDHYGVQLMIVNVTEEDLGLYTCYVSNHLGTDYRSALLSRIEKSTVPPSNGLGAPRFAEPEKLKRAFIAWPESHTIRLKCKAIGAPPLKYTWLKDGKRVTSRRLDPYLNTTIWFLRLKELVPTDSGKYTCNVSNPYGSISHTYTVEVVAKQRSKPILHSSIPKNTSVQLGGNATMKCVVFLSGTLPAFRWLKWDKVTTANPKIEEDGTDSDGTSYHLIDPIHYTTIKVGDHYGVQLMIVNVTEEDLGLYTCYVSNHLGTDYRSALLSRIEKSTVPPSNGNGFTHDGEFSMGETQTRMSAPAENLPQKMSNPTGQIALILLAVFVVVVVIGVVLFVFRYCKR